MRYTYAIEYKIFATHYNVFISSPAERANVLNTHAPSLYTVIKAKFHMQD
jgi:hypothetical protein